MYAQREIEFSGYRWKVKESNMELVGPGPNIFSSTNLNVFLDEQGRLVLRALKINGNWYCAEVIADSVFGFGTYMFEIQSNSVRLHKNLVFGMFTYDPFKQDGHNEIDIEFSKWGKYDYLNTQYAVHKDSLKHFTYRFFTPDKSTLSSHVIEWFPDKVILKSYFCPLADIAHTKAYMTYTFNDTGFLSPAREKVHLNLWKYGKMKTTKKVYEISIIQFRFIPLQNK